MTAQEIADLLRAEIAEVTLTSLPGDVAVVVPMAQWRQTAFLVRQRPELAFDFLRSLAGVDRPELNKIEVVAHLFSYQHRQSLVLKTVVDRAQPVLDSLAQVWPAANWHERELYDLFGVVLRDHPDLRRLLLPDDWVGYPLRKDYQEAATYAGIPTVRPAHPAGSAKEQ